MGSIYIREGSGNWRLRYHDAGGKLKRRSSGTTNKTLALSLLAKLEAETLEQKAAKGLQQAKVGFSTAKPGLSLEQRVDALEQAVHCLITDKDIQVQFLEAWARSSRSLLSK